MRKWSKRTTDQKRKANKARKDRRKVNPEWRKAKNHRRRLNRIGDIEFREQSRKQKADWRGSYLHKAQSYETLINKGHDDVCVCCEQLFSDIGIARDKQKALAAIPEDETLQVVYQLREIEFQLCSL